MRLHVFFFWLVIAPLNSMLAIVCLHQAGVDLNSVVLHSTVFFSGLVSMMISIWVFED